MTIIYTLNPRVAEPAQRTEINPALTSEVLSSSTVNKIFLSESVYTSIRALLLAYDNPTEIVGIDYAIGDVMFIGDAGEWPNTPDGIVKAGTRDEPLYVYRIADLKVIFNV